MPKGPARQSPDQNREVFARVYDDGHIKLAAQPASTSSRRPTAMATPSAGVQAELDHFPGEGDKSSSGPYQPDEGET